MTQTSDTSDTSDTTPGDGLAVRFAGDLGRSVTGGGAPALGSVAALAGWLLVFGSYAMISYRRSARTA